MKTLFLIIGLVALALGLLWIGQGLHYINWPKQTFMIGQNKWAYYGACLAIVGLLIIWFSRR